MAAIITDDFRKNNIGRFIDDVSNSPAAGGREYYIGIGKTEPYPNQGDNLSVVEGAADFIVPNPVGSVLEKEDIKNNLITLKRIKNTDILRLVPQIKWKSGTVFKVYDRSDPSCFDASAQGGEQPAYALFTDADGNAKIYTDH